MLKFQNNNATLIATFEDFILTAYVVDAKLFDPEIITISICGELAGIDSENVWFFFVKKNYRHLFPNLCSRSRFNRTRRALFQTTNLSYGTQAFKQQSELAEIGASVSLPTPKACRNCIFPVKRTVTCRKSAGQKLSGLCTQIF